MWLGLARPASACEVGLALQRASSAPVLSRDWVPGVPVQRSFFGKNCFANYVYVKSSPRPYDTAVDALEAFPSAVDSGTTCCIDLDATSTLTRLTLRFQLESGPDLVKTCAKPNLMACALFADEVRQSPAAYGGMKLGGVLLENEKGRI
jgi:hypothetical protein